MLLVGLGGARAPAEDFPSSLERPTLTSWLKANTDLPVDRVALAGPVHVVAVTPGRRDGKTGMLRATVEGEVVDRDWAARHKLVSWRTDVEVDCQSRRVKSPTGNSYGQRKRKGPATAIFASADWTTPPPTDPIFGVVQAICVAEFPWPLRAPKAAPVQVAVRKTRPASPPSPPHADAPIVTGERVAPSPPEPPPLMAVARAEPDRPSPAAPPTATMAGPAPARAPPVERAQAKPRPAASGRGPYAAQILAAATPAKARAELSRVSKVLSQETRGLSQAVVAVTVGGKVYHRAMFRGLDSAAQANGLCQAVTRLGYECLVRRM